ncbi:MAG: hypothetical protein QW667_06125 [Candidatus Bathyarchaeia archaeon]
MPAKRMRVEIYDNEGNKYSVSIEGEITREKAMRLLDLMELLGGMPAGTSLTNNPLIGNYEISKYDKVNALIRKHFPIAWFSSREVQAVYEQEFKEPIGLSTIATYLSRMADRGFLMKTGSPKNLKYKVAPSVPQTSLKQQMF